MTAVTLEANRRMASASSSVIRGLFRVRSISSSLVMIPRRSTRNASAPTSDRITVFTSSVIPWISETRVTIDVTATMFPRIVRKERSLLAQIALNAICTIS